METHFVFNFRPGVSEADGFTLTSQCLVLTFVSFTALRLPPKKLLTPFVLGNKLTSLSSPGFGKCSKLSRTRRLAPVWFRFDPFGISIYAIYRTFCSKYIIMATFERSICSLDFQITDADWTKQETGHKCA